MSDLLIPGKRRNIDRKRAGAVMDECYGLWVDQTNLGVSPLGYMRQDAYWALLEVVMELYMKPTRGGVKWDNRRKRC